MKEDIPEPRLPETLADLQAINRGIWEGELPGRFEIVGPSAAMARLVRDIMGVNGYSLETVKKGNEIRFVFTRVDEDDEPLALGHWF